MLIMAHSPGGSSSFVIIRVDSWLSLFVRFRYFRLFRILSEGSWQAGFNQEVNHDRDDDNSG
jgi:hypothetical protein